MECFSIYGNKVIGSGGFLQPNIVNITTTMFLASVPISIVTFALTLHLGGIIGTLDLDDSGETKSRENDHGEMEVLSVRDNTVVS